MPENNGAVRIARPTITIAEQDQPALAQGLLSLLIVENTSGLYRCEARFGNWGSRNNAVDFLYFDRSLLDFGKALKIKLGTTAIFEGRITGLEAQFPEGRPPQITVLAEDRFQDLRMTRRTRTFAEVTEANVITQIANEHGLSPDVDVTGPQHKVLAQVNQSDLAFLRERVRAIDAELWMEGNKLHAKSRVRRNEGRLELTYGTQLCEFSALADLSGQRTAVSVNGWEVASKNGIKHEATETVINGELNGDVSGVSILASAFGGRKEALAHTVPLTNQEAQAEADTFFKMSARRFVLGRGVAETDSRLRVGNYVELKSLGPLFSGKYYLSEVRHVFDGAKGIRTEFTGERPGIGRA